MIAGSDLASSMSFLALSGFMLNSLATCSNLSFILLNILLTSLGSEKPNHKSFFPVRLPFSAAVIISYQYALPITQAIIIILASLTCSIFHLTSSLDTILDLFSKSILILFPWCQIQ